MRNVLIFLASLFVGFHAAVLNAEEAVVGGSVTLPTTKVNGDPLPVAEIAQINLYYGVDGNDPGATGPRLIVLTASAAAFTVNVPVVPSPTAQTIIFRASVTDTSGMEGGISDPISWTGIIDVPTPASPPGVPVLVPFIISDCVSGQCVITSQ